MYVSTPIRWLIDLDGGGGFLGFVQMEGEGRRGKRGKEFLAPHVGRSSAIVAKLLVDRADYVLGVAPAGADNRRRERTAAAHDAFVALVQECATSTRAPSVRAVLTFLKSLNLDALAFPPDLAPGDVVAFRVNGVLSFDLPSVQQFWAERYEREVVGAAGGTAVECLICGRWRPPATRHRIKIKRIPGGQPSGMALVSANKPAFESYGLAASLIAPICAQCTEEYANAANNLIEGEQTHFVIGPLIYIFWTRDGEQVPVFSLLQDPQPDDVKHLLKAPWTGQAGAAEIEVAPFYATALGSSGGRVAVREWLETTVGQAKEQLRKYFVMQKVVEWNGSEGRPIGLYPLAASLVGQGNDIPPVIPKALLRLALAGTPLPLALLAEAVGRTRAHRRGEAAVTHPRAAVVKMVLLSRYREEDGKMEQLDPNLRNPAYLCGRIFAIVEAVQRTALGDINVTVADRYFGAASSSPAYVLGKLVSDAKKAHMGKLRRQNPAAYYALNQRLEEAMEGLSTFPATLTLEDQGRFVLGYYHQRAADRAAARARRELRALAQDEDTEDSPR
jgi:CRISPR-associated protein Csd1